MRLRASSTETLLPAASTVRAAACPAMPAPITTTSVSAASDGRETSASAVAPRRLRRRITSVLPRERKELLADVACGHVIPQHTVLLRETPVRRHGRAKDVIEEGEMRGIIAVDRLALRTVMPVVEVRRYDQPLERRTGEGRGQRHVGVVEHRLEAHNHDVDVHRCFGE